MCYIDLDPSLDLASFGLDLASFGLDFGPYMLAEAASACCQQLGHTVQTPDSLAMKQIS